MPRGATDPARFLERALRRRLLTPASRRRTRAAFAQLVTEVSTLRALSLSQSELEGLIQERGLAVMRQLLQGHVDLRGPGEAQRPVKTRAGVVLTHQRWDRERQWESIFGTIALTRVG